MLDAFGPNWLLDRFPTKRHCGRERLDRIVKRQFCRWYPQLVIDAKTATTILNELKGSTATGSEFRMLAMHQLDRLPGYDWSGIYRMENGGLVLDEFVGEPTEHKNIAVGVGVCGTAVKENRNVVVEDVRELDNYLSCSLQTRSEVVVLIRKANEILGQIDIDGHTVGAFDRSDEELLESLATLIAERW